MILKTLSQAIKQQNWFAVVLELLIVIVGVYVGIYIGDTFNERALRLKIDRSLEVLQAQLVDDLTDLDQVIEYQSRQQQLYLLLTNLLVDPEIDKEAYAVAYEEVLNLNRTFYPNRSQFESIRDLGYLPEIEDADLQQQLSGLYEQVYRRHDVNAELTDEEAVYHEHVWDTYWDRIGRDFIDQSPEAIIRLRNGNRSMMGSSRYYRQILVDEVRPQITQTVEGLKTYLSKR